MAPWAATMGACTYRGVPRSGIIFEIVRGGAILVATRLSTIEKRRDVYMSSLFVINFARSHCKANELWFGVSPSGISLFVRVSSCLCCLLPHSPHSHIAPLAITGCRPLSRDGLALPQFIQPLHLQGPTASPNFGNRSRFRATRSRRYLDAHTFSPPTRLTNR